MLGVLVNAAAVIAGGLIGLLLKKGIPSRLNDIMTKAVALAVLYIGITGIIGEMNFGAGMGGKYTLILIICTVLGGLIGGLIKIEERFSSFVEKTEKRFSKNPDKPQVAQGFISASLLFCVGAMTIVGSLEAGIQGNNSTLFAKSLLDFISSIILASGLGVGVALSSVFVFVFQGAIALLGQFIAPVLTDYCISMMSSVGSLLIIALSLNMMGITKTKILNLMPGVLLPVLLCLI